MKTIAQQALERTWICSQGLLGHGQEEVAVPIASGETDGAVALLAELHDYVCEQNRRVTADQTMLYGYTNLHFRAANTEERRLLACGLVVQELGEPLTSDSGFYYVDGARFAMALRKLDAQTMYRLRQPRAWLTPFRAEWAALCSQLASPELPPQNLYMERQEPSEKTDSGWTFLCEDDAHHQADGFLQRVHLHHVVQRFPFVVPYLGSLAGSGVRFSGPHIIFLPPGSQSGRLDPVSRWRGFPQET